MRRILQKSFIIVYLALALVCLGKVSANSANEYLIDEQIFSGDFSAAKDVYSHLHFNRNGNDF